MQSHNLQFLLSTDANAASIRITLSSKLTITTNLLRTCLRPWTGCYQCKGEIEKILSVTEGICGRSKTLELQGQQWWHPPSRVISVGSATAWWWGWERGKGQAEATLLNQFYGRDPKSTSPVLLVICKPPSHFSFPIC